MASREKTGPKGAKQGKPPPDRTGRRARCGLRTRRRGRSRRSATASRSSRSITATTTGKSTRTRSTTRRRLRAIFGMEDGPAPLARGVDQAAASRRFPALPQGADRASEGRDAALLHRVPLSRQSRPVALGAPERHRAAPAATATPTAWSAPRSTSPTTSAGSRSSPRRAPRSRRRAKTCAPCWRT